MQRDLYSGSKPNVERLAISCQSAVSTGQSQSGLRSETKRPGRTVSIKTHQSRVCSSLTGSRKSAAIPTGKSHFASRNCAAERTQNRSDGIGTGRNDESPAIARSSITVELHPLVIEIGLLGGRDLHEDRNCKMVQLLERLRFHQAS